MRLAAVLLLVCLALPAAAEAPLRPDDRARIDALDVAAGAALRQALAGGDPADVAVLADALRGAPVPVDAADLAGDWTCRTIKAGGIMPLAVYSPFRCRVTVAGKAVTFEKLTGSQRVKGAIVAEERRLLLLGAGFIAGDTPPDYAALPAEADPSASPQRVPAPGVIEMTSPRQGRILFPRPLLESVMDILVLSRP